MFSHRRNSANFVSSSDKLTKWYALCYHVFSVLSLVTGRPKKEFSSFKVFSLPVFKPCVVKSNSSQLLSHFHFQKAPMSSAVPVVRVLSLVWSADVGSQFGFVLEIAPVTGLTSLNVVSFICETRTSVCHREAISCHQVSGKGRLCLLWQRLQ